MKKKIVPVQILHLIVYLCLNFFYKRSWKIDIWPEKSLIICSSSFLSTSVSSNILGKKWMFQRQLLSTFNLVFFRIVFVYVYFVHFRLQIFQNLSTAGKAQHFLTNITMIVFHCLQTLRLWTTMNLYWPWNVNWDLFFFFLLLLFIIICLF